MSEQVDIRELRIIAASIEDDGKPIIAAEVRAAAREIETLRRDAEVLAKLRSEHGCLLPKSLRKRCDCEGCWLAETISDCEREVDAEKGEQ